MADENAEASGSSSRPRETDTQRSQRAFSRVRTAAAGAHVDNDGSMGGSEWAKSPDALAAQSRRVRTVPREYPISVSLEHIFKFTGWQHRQCMNRLPRRAHYTVLFHSHPVPLTSLHHQRIVNDPDPDCAILLPDHPPPISTRAVPTTSHYGGPSRNVEWRRCGRGTCGRREMSKWPWGRWSLVERAGRRKHRRGGFDLIRDRPALSRVGRSLRT